RWWRFAIPRAGGKQRTLDVKEVVLGDWGPVSNPRRYIVCFNPRKPSAMRPRGPRFAGLTAKLDQGDMALVANDGYRRFLAMRAPLRDLPGARRRRSALRRPLRAAHQHQAQPPRCRPCSFAYRELWRVEQIFRTAEAILNTRLIFHQADTTSPAS